MRLNFAIVICLFLALLSFFYTTKTIAKIPTSARSLKAIQSKESILKKEFILKGFKWGSPIFIRILKKEKRLEFFIKKSKKFKLFKTYPICYFSGNLGPKEKEGDRQSPEGFYFVKPSQLNPWSSYHLSFNIGFPNKYDREHGRTGKYLMVHGSCVSIGCYAMTDGIIEEIYTLINEAFKQGQPYFKIHIFPFKMKNISKYKKNKWFSFWQNLKEGYDYFEHNQVPPNTEVLNKKYSFN